MIALFQVHKETYGHWPAKNGKAAGESFDLDLIDISEPPQHAYRGILIYRLPPNEKDKFCGEESRQFVKVVVHEIQSTPRGPVLRGEILSLTDKP